MSVLNVLRADRLRRFRFTLCRALFIAERFFFGLAFGGKSNLLAKIDL